MKSHVIYPKLLNIFLNVFYILIVSNVFRLLGMILKLYKLHLILCLSHEKFSIALSKLKEFFVEVKSRTLNTLILIKDHQIATSSSFSSKSTLNETLRFIF